MKILYFTPFYPPQGEAAATRAYWFTKALIEAKHQVIVLNASDFTLRPASNKDRAVVRLLKENLAGIELFFRVITSRSDLIILSSPPFFTVIWGAIGAIVSGQKFILDVRDLYPEIFFELKMIRENSLAGKFARSLTKFLYRRAHEVITVTQGLCREISAYGEKRPHLIMNGYDPDLFFPGKPEEKFPRFTMVFHGTMGKMQNIETLLKLASILENEEIDILVAGDGPKVEEILEANRKNIKYLGNVPYGEIPLLLRKCHLGLSFRTDDKIGKEAFPVKVFEYVGSAIPVVLAPKGEAGQIVEKNNYGKEFENSEVILMKEHILSVKNNYKAGLKAGTEYSRSEQSKLILRLIS